MEFVKAICLLIIGILSFLSGLKYIKFRNRVKIWPSVQGQLIEKTIGKPLYTSIDGGNSNRIFVKYTYTIENNSYDNTVFYAHEINLGERTNTTNLTKRIITKIENQPTVYYNPEKHSESYLKLGSSMWGYVMLIGGFLFVLTSVILLTQNLSGY